MQMTMSKWQLKKESSWTIAPTWNRVPKWATPWRPARFSATGYTLYGMTAGTTGTGNGLCIRPREQSRDEIQSLLDSLPTHREDYLEQRRKIPEWALNRGGGWKMAAPYKPAPGGQGYTYAPGAIVVSPYVDVEDNWILYHPNVYGIVAEMGGKNSHGVVVARERNIPIVVGIDVSKIRPGDNLTVDGERGIVQVNGGGNEVQDDFTPQVAEEPTIAWVWSAAGADAQPIPPGSEGAQALHVPMVKKLMSTGKFDMANMAMGVTYEDGRTEIFQEIGDTSGLQEFLDQIYREL